MKASVNGKLLGQIAAATCLLCLFLASNALAAADAVNLTRFSKTVSGSIPGFTGSVTVDLLRNTQNSDGVTVRQQVDTFTAPVDGSGNWSGSFSKHAFAVGADEVEVNYAGTPGQQQVTIGEGNQLSSSQVSGASHRVHVSADTLDGNIGISADGSTLDASCNASCNNFTVKVDANPPTSDPGGSFTFTPHLTNANTVIVTGTVTSGGTTVNLTDSAPLLDPPAADRNPTSSYSMPEPGCVFYLVTSEVVCFNLVPGSYGVTQLRGATTIATRALTVPSRPGVIAALVPALGAAALTGVAGGDRLRLSLGARALTMLTINPSTLNFKNRFTDLLNGFRSTVTGQCASEVWFNNGTDLCLGGALPTPNSVGDGSTALTSIGGTGNVIGQLDDTSSGSTEIDMPDLSFTTPRSRESIRTPFNVYALVRYDDPADLALNQDNRPASGSNSVVNSRISNAPVQFALAPFGSGSFRTIGNADRAGGLALTGLAGGPYVDRWTITDPRGDVFSNESSFYVLPNAPSGPPPPRCKAKSSGGLKATVAASGSSRASRSRTVTLTLTCSSKTAGARVTLWLERGTNTIANGSGIVRHRSVKVTLRGPFKRGVYRLIEVIDAGGRATESTQTLTLKGR